MDPAAEVQRQLQLGRRARSGGRGRSSSASRRGARRRCRRGSSGGSRRRRRRSRPRRARRRGRWRARARCGRRGRCGRSSRRRRSSAGRRRCGAWSARRGRGRRRAGRRSSSSPGISSTAYPASRLRRTWRRSLGRDFGFSAGSAICTTLRSVDPASGTRSSRWRMKAETSPVREKSTRRIDPGPPERSHFAYAALRTRSGTDHREPRVAVGADRVEVGAVADLADDQRRQQLGVVGLDPQRVGRALGFEEVGAAEELAGVAADAPAGRGTAVLDQLGEGPAHPNRSAVAARNSSGRTPQTSQSSGGSPSRARCSRIVPSYTQPWLATVFLAISLRAGMRP